MLQHPAQPIGARAVHLYGLLRARALAPARGRQAHGAASLMNRGMSWQLQGLFLAALPCLGEWRICKKRKLLTSHMTTLAECLTNMRMARLLCLHSIAFCADHSCLLKCQCRRCSTGMRQHTYPLHYTVHSQVTPCTLPAQGVWSPAHTA